MTPPNSPEPEPIVMRLLDLGLSKYAIAKFVNVSFDRVVAWSRGWYRPLPHNKAKLMELLSIEEEKHNKKFEQLTAEKKFQTS